MKNHRNFLIFLILILLLIPITVSAVDYSGSFDVTNTVSTSSYTPIVDGSGGTGELIHTMAVNDLADLQNLKGISGSYPRAYFVWDYSLGNSWSDTIEAWVGAVKIGEGSFRFNNNSATGQVIVSFYPTEWDTKGITGKQSIDFKGDAYFTAHGLADLSSVATTHGDLSGAFPIGFNPHGHPDGYDIYDYDYIVYSQLIFKNDWSLTKSTVAVNILVDKNINSVAYKSKVSYVSEAGAIIYNEPTFNSDDLDIFTTTIPLSLRILDMGGVYHNTSYYYTYGTQFTLIVNPESVGSYESTTVNTGSSTGFTGIDNMFFWDYTLDAYGNRQSPISIYKFKNNVTHYELYNESSHGFYDTSINPAYFSYSGFDVGTHHIVASLYTNTTNFEVYDTLIVIPSITGAVVPIHFGAVDGSNSNHLTDYELQIQNVGTGVWKNYTHIPYEKVITCNMGDVFFIKGIKGGYTTETMYYTVPNLPSGSFGTFANVMMYPINLIVGGNTTLMVQVYTNTGYKIPNALVTLSDGQYKNTGINGEPVNFTLAFSNTYHLTLSASGYDSLSDVFDTTTEATLLKIYQMTPSVVPSYTPSPSIFPTLKPTPYATEGGMVVEGVFCPNPTNLIDSIDYSLCTQLGIVNKTVQDLIKALMIIFASIIILSYLGRNTDNLGVLAMLGAVIGFIASLVLGFIPLWVLLALLGLGFLVVILLRRG